MAPATTCACPRCTCEVQAAQAVFRDGQSFCSEACATGHPNQEPYHGSGSCGCTCADRGSRVIHPLVVRAGLSSIVSPDTVRTMVRVPNRIG
ncbi:metallothionein [Synechococcus sp. N19]|uniref:metallothionein n=1 Tax=Synechococcus sp. N19 TaxID=2575512 RepID=UPI000E0F0B63